MLRSHPTSSFCCFSLVQNCKLSLFVSIYFRICFPFAVRVELTLLSIKKKEAPTLVPPQQNTFAATLITLKKRSFSSSPTRTRRAHCRDSGTDCRYNTDCSLKNKINRKINKGIGARSIILRRKRFTLSVYTTYHLSTPQQAVGQPKRSPLRRNIAPLDSSTFCFFFFFFWLKYCRKSLLDSRHSTEPTKPRSQKKGAPTDKK